MTFYKDCKIFSVVGVQPYWVVWLFKLEYSDNQWNTMTQTIL